MKPGANFCAKKPSPKIAESAGDGYKPEAERRSKPQARHARRIAMVCLLIDLAPGYRKSPRKKKTSKRLTLPAKANCLTILEIAIESLPLLLISLLV